MKQSGEAGCGQYEVDSDVESYWDADRSGSGVVRTKHPVLPQNSPRPLGKGSPDGLDKDNSSRSVLSKVPVRKAGGPARKRRRKERTTPTQIVN